MSQRNVGAVPWCAGPVKLKYEHPNCGRMIGRFTFRTNHGRL